jgi:hypothetical protein
MSRQVARRRHVAPVLSPRPRLSLESALDATGVVEGDEIHKDGRAGQAVEVPAWGAVEASEAEVSQLSRRPERWVGDHGSPQGAVGAHRQHCSALEVELGQPAVEGPALVRHAEPTSMASTRGGTSCCAAPAAGWAVPAVVEVGRGPPAVGWIGWGRLRGAAAAGCPAEAWRRMGPRSKIAGSSNVGGTCGSRRPKAVQPKEIHPAKESQKLKREAL